MSGREPLGGMRAAESALSVNDSVLQSEELHGRDHQRMIEREQFHRANLQRLAGSIEQCDIRPERLER